MVDAYWWYDQVWSINNIYSTSYTLNYEIYKLFFGEKRYQSIDKQNHPMLSNIKQYINNTPPQKNDVLMEGFEIWGV